MEEDPDLGVLMEEDDPDLGVLMEEEDPAWLFL